MWFRFLSCLMRSSEHDELRGCVISPCGQLHMNPTSLMHVRDWVHVGWSGVGQGGVGWVVLKCDKCVYTFLGFDLEMHQYQHQYWILDQYRGVRLINLLSFDTCILLLGFLTNVQLCIIYLKKTPNSLNFFMFFKVRKSLLRSNSLIKDWFLSVALIYLLY